MHAKDGAPIADLGRRARTSRLSPRWAQLGVLVLAVAASKEARAQTSLRDDRGVTVALARSPQRIVSLLPSLTESVCVLGACARLVGTDRFSTWPASAAALPKLGGIEDAPIERVIALKPDVVLVSVSARIIDRLESLGLKVIALESRNREDVRRTLRLLAQMLGTPTAADGVWAEIERETAVAAARVPARLGGARVYFEVDSTPYAAGPGSFIGETLSRLGLANALPAALGPFPKLNPEYVVRLQPDIVMAVAPALAEMPRRPGWGALRALATGQSCGFPSASFDVITRSGPRMGEAAAALADCLVAIAKAR